MEEMIKICKEQIASCPTKGDCQACQNAKDILKSLGQIVNLTL